MDLSTLLVAVVGGLIAVIPVLITIRNQSIERDKDRQEQRREAKTQLALELLRNDIKVIEDSIDNELKSVNILNAINSKRHSGKLSKNAAMHKVESALRDENS